MASLVRVNMKHIKSDEKLTMFVNPRTMKFFHDIDTITDDDLIYSSPSNRNKPLLVKAEKPTKIKFFLGNTCNYHCSYCRQDCHGKLEKHDASDIKYVVDTIKRLTDVEKDLKIQFWGGEPLLYMDDMIRIAEQLPKHIRYHLISNGSLMDKEIAEWVLSVNSQYTLSHDGTGQAMRGKDPLDDETARKYLLHLAHSKRDKKSFVVSSVLTEMNLDIYELYKYLENVFGVGLIMSKMELAIPYNEHAGSVARNTLAHENLINTLFEGLVKLNKENLVDRIIGFEIALKVFFGLHYNPHYCIDLHEPKCGLANEMSICFDWNGTVVPCQVFGGTDTIIGHVDRYPVLDKPELPMTMWSKPECKDCVVVSLCRGVCPYLEEQYVATNCTNKFIFYYAIFKYVMFNSGYDILGTEVIEK